MAHPRRAAGRLGRLWRDARKEARARRHRPRLGRQSPGVAARPARPCALRPCRHCADRHLHLSQKRIHGDLSPGWRVPRPLYLAEARGGAPGAGPLHGRTGFPAHGRQPLRIPTLRPAQPASLRRPARGRRGPGGLRIAGWRQPVGGCRGHAPAGAARPGPAAADAAPLCRAPGRGAGQAAAVARRAARLRRDRPRPGPPDPAGRAAGRRRPRGAGTALVRHLGHRVPRRIPGRAELPATQAQDAAGGQRGAAVAPRRCAHARFAPNG